MTVKQLRKILIKDIGKIKIKRSKLRKIINEAQQEIIKE
jgi:hypothetical protein